MISYCVQDCVAVLGPFPNNPNPVQSFNNKTDFDLQGGCLVWYARLQLFFNCSVCPTGAKRFSDSHKGVSLVYFSTFEPIELTPDSIMQQAGVPMLYDSASTLACPASTSAPWLTCLGAPPSLSASSAATITPRFHTTSGTIRDLDLCRQSARQGQR